MRKSIVITGASKGIGRAVADPLAEQGWSVIGVARFSPTISRSFYRDRPCRPESDLCSRQGLGRSRRRVWNREQCGPRQA